MFLSPRKFFLAEFQSAASPYPHQLLIWFPALWISFLCFRASCTWSHTVMYITVWGFFQSILVFWDPSILWHVSLVCSFLLQISCCRLNICAHPPPPTKSTGWNLIPSLMLLRGGAFGRWLGHEGWVLISGISALHKKGPKHFSLPSYNVGLQWKDSGLWTRKQFSLNTFFQCCDLGLSSLQDYKK